LRISLSLQQIDFPTDDARTLLSELDAELNTAYSPEQRHGFNIARLFRPNIIFLLAFLDTRPVGCGGIAFEPDFAELKRMYVRPDARGRGVAQAILARLEAEASRKGIARITLETGDAQSAAIRFYERAGFKRCGPFGDYVAMPPPAIECSVFLDKTI
jgi:putative acetyltransferase